MLRPVRAHPKVQRVARRIHLLPNRRAMHIPSPRRPRPRLRNRVAHKHQVDMLRRIGIGGIRSRYAVAAVLIVLRTRSLIRVAGDRSARRGSNRFSRSNRSSSRRLSESRKRQHEGESERKESAHSATRLTRKTVSRIPITLGKRAATAKPRRQPRPATTIPSVTRRYSRYILVRHLRIIPNARMKNSPAVCSIVSSLSK